MTGFAKLYLKYKKGKIDLSDWRYSKLDEVLGTYSYLFPPRVMIKSVYSKKRDDGIGIYNQEYGTLISYELLYDGKRVFRVKGKNSSFIGYSMILEALQDRLSSLNQRVVVNDDITVVFEQDDHTDDPDGTINGFNIIPEYLFLLSPVMHTSYNKEKTGNDTSGIISLLKSNESVCRFQKEHVRGMIQVLVDNDVPISYMISDTIYRWPKT